jgi:hypothetical protein
MKTEKELNEDILKITMQIQEKYPELSKNIGETPVKISDTKDTGINMKILNEYYQSLNNLLKHYATSHGSSTK